MEQGAWFKKTCGACFEIGVDGNTRSYRDQKQPAIEVGKYLKQKQPPHRDRRGKHRGAGCGACEEALRSGRRRPPMARRRRRREADHPQSTSSRAVWLVLSAPGAGVLRADDIRVLGRAVPEGSAGAPVRTHGRQTRRGVRLPRVHLRGAGVASRMDELHSPIPARPPPAVIWSQWMAGWCTLVIAPPSAPHMETHGSGHNSQDCAGGRKSPAELFVAAIGCPSGAYTFGLRKRHLVW